MFLPVYVLSVNDLGQKFVVLVVDVLKVDILEVILMGQPANFYSNFLFQIL
jgi:hypothetical protein